MAKMTYLGEVFGMFQRALAGNPDDMKIKIEPKGYTSSAVFGTFTDPYNGGKYRVAIVPIERELVLGAWTEQEKPREANNVKPFPATIGGEGSC